MRTKTTIVLPIIFLLAIGLFANATGQRRGRSVEEQLSELKERLALTDEQVKQIEPILKKRQEEMLALREKLRGKERSPSTRRTFREEMRKIARKTEEELERVLTEEQMKEFKKLQESRRGRSGQRRGRPQ